MADANDEDWIAPSLAAMGFPPRGFVAAPLSGGVSCDVVRIAYPTRTICLKRALPKLRVKADWRAPAARSTTEVAWLKLAASIAPGSVPEVLGEDEALHVFAMDYLPVENHPVWKAELAAGRIDVEFAAAVGGTLAKLHAATATRADLAAAFAHQDQFYALRLEPFFVHVAARHPDLATLLNGLVDSVSAARIALMQGDISPKNILCGPRGPVFLDAETACYGDPAFDVAFCLNQLLLKCVWHPQWMRGYRESFDAFTRAYLAGVTWEPRDALAARAAVMLPVLSLARVDGKSPADYLDSEKKRDFVRQTAIALLRAGSLEAIAASWADAVAKTF